jgi:hypothetical protein
MVYSLMRNELGWTWKQPALGCFEQISWNILMGTEEGHVGRQSIIHYSRSLRRDSNRDFAGYKSEVSPHESSSCVPVV